MESYELMRKLFSRQGPLIGYFPVIAADLNFQNEETFKKSLEEILEDEDSEIIQRNEWTEETDFALIAFRDHRNFLDWNASLKLNFSSLEALESVEYRVFLGSEHSLAKFYPPKCLALGRIEASQVSDQFFDDPDMESRLWIADTFGCMDQLLELIDQVLVQFA